MCISFTGIKRLLAEVLLEEVIPDAFALETLSFTDEYVKEFPAGEHAGTRGWMENRGRPVQRDAFLNPPQESDNYKMNPDENVRWGQRWRVSNELRK